MPFALRNAGLILGIAAGAAAGLAGRQTAPEAGRVESVAEAAATLDEYSFTCHNTRVLAAGLALGQLDLAQVGQNPETWEPVVRKLRTGTMPPQGNRCPGAAKRGHDARTPGRRSGPERRPPGG